MSLANFRVVDRNPNEDIGGGGCVCSPTKTSCAGPYAVFPASETDSNVSPHVVVSLACAAAFADVCLISEPTGEDDAPAL